MKIQKRLAGQLLKASAKRIKFDNERLADINEAITKTDIRILIDEKAIIKKQEKGVSRGRARKIMIQKSKGKRKGKGSKSGKSTARLPKKEAWMNKIRSQREFLATLRKSRSISDETYREMYRKSKGGFFRSVRHIKITLEDQGLFQKPKTKKQETEKKETNQPTTSKTKKKTTKKITKKSMNSKKSE